MDSLEPNSLNADVFFKDNFCIEDYLLQCIQKQNLLTLRKELKSYGHGLYMLMIDILKTETEDIINLAENLTNLNSKIDELSVPISQLCEEIRTLCYTINEAKINFKKQLDVIQFYTGEKTWLSLKIEIMVLSNNINDVLLTWEDQEDLTVLERIVNEYSFQYLYLKELDLESGSNNEDVGNTIARLVTLINKVFLKELRRKDADAILRCLRMYVNLEKQTEAELTVKTEILKPALNKIFTQKNLDKCGQNIKPLYDEAMILFNREIGILLNTLKNNSDINGFNFVINSFWIEVNKQLCENLQNITAPGNPELFQRRFKDTWKFLREIVSIVGDSSLLKNDSSFETHLKRFNLSVYFEIRFQQIAGKFEAETIFDPIELLDSNLKDQRNENELFSLKITNQLCSCIKQCFQEEVFLVQLADQFFRLMMLLVSRYLRWFEVFLNRWKDFSDVSISKQLEKFVIYTLIDLDTLINVIDISKDNTNEYGNTIFKIIPLKMHPALQEIIKINKKLLKEMYDKLVEKLVSTKVQQSLLYLQQVTSIPRLYRRTNRNIPKEPSHYVIDATAPIAKFYRDYKVTMANKIETIMDVIIHQLSERYLILVKEVLHSVCKTEESLRRLKNRNLNVTDEAQVSGDSTTDEVKIREQIRLDGEYFSNEIQQFSLPASRNSIVLLVEECRRVTLQ